MKGRWMVLILCAFLLLWLPAVSVAQEAGVVITPRSESLTVNVKKSATVKVTISPKTARDKGVSYESDDPSVAKVSGRGKVTGVSPGECHIVVTSKYDPQTSVIIPVSVLLPVKSIALSADNDFVEVGETLPLQADFLPEEATFQEATYKSSKPKVATVDEDGVVMGVKAGRVTITATAADGGRARDRLSLRVLQPITGASFDYPRARVGVNLSKALTAVLEPANASNRKITWTSDDETVATVTGRGEKAAVKGVRWGEAVITGITEDGGYEASVVVDVGRLDRAVTIVRLKLNKDGRPSVQLVNNSNMNMTEVRFVVKVYDKHGKLLSDRGKYSLSGVYQDPLGAGERTEYGDGFYYHGTIRNPAAVHFELAVTGWTTETGYYDKDGNLQYTYKIPAKDYDWGWGQ